MQETLDRLAAERRFPILGYLPPSSYLRDVRLPHLNPQVARIALLRRARRLYRSISALPQSFWLPSTPADAATDRAQG